MRMVIGFLGWMVIGLSLQGSAILCLMYLGPLWMNWIDPPAVSTSKAPEPGVPYIQIGSHVIELVCPLCGNQGEKHMLEFRQNGVICHACGHNLPEEE